MSARQLTDFQAQKIRRLRDAVTHMRTALLAAEGGDIALALERLSFAHFLRGLFTDEDIRASVERVGLAGASATRRLTAIINAQLRRSGGAL